MRWRWLAGLVPLCLMTQAAAQPRVKVEASGQCPSVQQVQDALTGVALVVAEEPSWRVSIISESGGARMVLFDPQGRAHLERRVDSSDCQALARALGVIVHAYFVELARLPEEERLPPAERNKVQPAPTTPRPSRAVPEPPRKKPRPSPTARIDPSPGRAAAEAEATEPATPSPIAEARIVAPSPLPVPPPQEPVVATRIEASRSGSRTMWVAGLGGAASGLSPTVVSAAAAVELGLRFRAWGLQLGGALTTPQDQSRDGERVTQTAFHAEAAAVHQLDLGDTTWLRLRAGGGLTWVRASAANLEGGRRTAAQAHALAAARVGLTLTSNLAAALDLQARLFPNRDQYLVEPTGVVAQSPRGQLALGLALEWAWP